MTVLGFHVGEEKPAGYRGLLVTVITRMEEKCIGGPPTWFWSPPRLVLESQPNLVGKSQVEEGAQQAG